MSVYGYPREPEETVDPVPPADLPPRVTSQPVSVPGQPPAAPPPGSAPPQPLLPATPPGAPYTNLGDLIPPQRPAADPLGPPESPGLPGALGASGEPAGDDFGWLRPAREPEPPASPVSPGGLPAAEPGPPPSPEQPGLGQPGLGQPSFGQPGIGQPGVGQPGVGQPGLGQPSLGQPGAAPPPFGQPGPGQPGPGQPAIGQPGLGQPGLGQPSVPPGFGPSPSLGQPVVADPEPTYPTPPHAEPAHAESTYAESTYAEPYAEPTYAGPTDAGPAPHPGSDGPFAADGLAAVWESAVRGDPALESLALLTQRTAPPVPPATESGGEPATGDRTAAEGEPRSGAQPPRDSRPGDAAAIRPPVTTPPRVPPAGDDVPEIPPWDRKPLFVVIAASVVLVLIGIVSGMVTAAVASAPLATWRDAGSATPEPGATPTSGESVAPPPEQETLTLSGVGDVIMGSTNLGVPPNGGAGFFDPVKTALAADLVMGNLDMALSDPTGFGKCDPGATDCFQLSLPPSFAGVLRDGGFGLMSLANNHTYDMGEQGYTNTRAALDAAGIKYTGGVDEITYVTVKGIEVAVLGFSVYSYTANLNNIPRAADLVRQASERADIVVIQMQGGAEGSDRTRVPPAGQHESFGGEDRGDLRGFAHAVIDAGADIVFGHGPHVMRGMEFYQGRLIAYSLGNFCGYAVLSSSGNSGVGGVLKVTLNRDGTWVSGELIATEMVGPGFPAIDADLRALSLVDGLSVQDFGDSAARIDHQSGAITAP